MKPTDMIIQLLGFCPSDDLITFSDDVIHIDGPINFRQQTYTHVTINLSQGITYFLQTNLITLRLAIKASLLPISVSSHSPDISELQPQQQNDDTL